MNVYNDELQTIIHSKAKCETSVKNNSLLTSEFGIYILFHKLWTIKKPPNVQQVHAKLHFLLESTARSWPLINTFV